MFAIVFSSVSLVCNFQELMPPNGLTKSEFAIIHKYVFEEGISVTYTTLMPRPQKTMHVKDDFKAVFVNHRKEVLDYLVKVVEAGQPRQSVTAIAYAHALTGTPSVGVWLADFDTGDFDKEEEKGQSMRKRLLKQVQKLK